MVFAVGTEVPVANPPRWLNPAGRFDDDAVIDIVVACSHSPIAGRIESGLDLDVPFVLRVGAGVALAEPIDPAIVNPGPGAIRYENRLAIRVSRSFPIHGVERLCVGGTAAIRIIG